MNHTRADRLIAYFVDEDERAQSFIFAIRRKGYHPIETQVDSGDLVETDCFGR
jgi:hypothetical protein